MTMETWARGTAHHLKLRGDLDYKVSRVGITIHMPCAHGEGHLVDVKVPPGLHPNGVAKRMLNAGWTIGSKPICPDHQRKKDPRAVENGKTRMSKLTPEEKTALSLKANQARWSKQKMAEPKPEPVRSDEAKKAHRLIVMALEDAYDDARKCYRAGGSDKSIAEETGAAEQYVAKIREEFFGPAGMPTEAQELRDEIAEAQREFAILDNQFRTARDRLTTLESKFMLASRRNGWA